MKILLLAIALLAIIPLAFFPSLSFHVRGETWGVCGGSYRGRVCVGLLAAVK